MANRHRANWSGGVDSKYYHDPEQFEKDVNTKTKQKEEMTEDVFRYLDEKIQDNPASIDTTFRCIIEAAIQVIEKYALSQYWLGKDWRNKHD